MTTQVAPSQAIEIADRSLKELVPAFASLGPHVEEIRLSADGNSWVINYRANNPKLDAEKQDTLNLIFPYVEKVVQIKVDSGDLLSIQNYVYE